MKLKVVSGITLTLLFIGMLTLAFKIQTVRAGTVIVPDDYPTIQAAINAATQGDTIYVKEGTYYENVVVNKTLSLIGENRITTIIDGNLKTGFHVISDNVNISGFTIRNCGPPEGGLFGGIRLDSSHNCKISGNKINNNYFGIWPDSSSNNTIFNNTFSYNGYAIGGVAMEGNNQNIFNNVISYNAFGIYLLKSNNSIISNNNIVTNPGLGIKLQSCSNTVLTNNNMIGNTYSLGFWGACLSHFIHDIDVSNTIDGKPVYYLINQSNLSIDPSTFPDVGYLGLVNSTNIIIKNLSLTRNGQGLLLAYTTHSTVMHLNISFNSIGIDIFSSSNNIITNNRITSNRYGGIEMNYLCDNNIICNNKISNNRNAITMAFNSDGNIVYHNNFISNTEQVILLQSASTWDNGYPSGGNYWSDYAGVDVKSGPNQDQPSSDGIGDTPYVIDSDNIDNYPLMNPWIQKCILTIYSSPTGVTFTVDGIPHTTPWSGTYSEGTSVSLVMPETHDGYVWSRWLEDGDPNRIKTVTMDTDIRLTATYVPKSVGGKATPINMPTIKPELQNPWIWLSTIILPLVATVVFKKLKKKKQQIRLKP